MELAATQEITSVSESLADAEAQLLAQIASGNRDALTELYHRERQPLFAYLLHLTSDAGIAEEVLQDTFVAVWKSAGSFAGRSRVRTWLIGIARRQAHNTLRRRALPRMDTRGLEELADPLPEPEEQVIINVSGDELAASIEQLSVAHREVLLLTFVHERSYAEVAQILQIPVGTVKSRLNHAKRALREILGPTREATR